MTRYEQIRDMTENQLAAFLCIIHGMDCEHCPFGKEKPKDYPMLCSGWWLMQEVGGQDDGQTP